MKGETLTGSIKKVSNIHTPNRSIKSYELSIGADDRIEKGYSGSAVVLEGSNRVIAIATDRNKNGKDAYAIPIAYLKEIWEEMPKLVTCEDEMNYKNNEEYQSSTQSINVDNENSNVTIIQNIGLNDKSLELIIQPYQKKITKLKKKLKNSHNDEEKIKYITLLEKANDEKAKKDKEIANLKELIDNAKYKIVKEATVIFRKLVMGFDLLNQPSTNLNEAEAVLQKFRGIPKAERLLGIIEKFRNKI